MTAFWIIGIAIAVSANQKTKRVSASVAASEKKPLRTAPYPRPIRAKKGRSCDRMGSMGLDFHAGG